MNGNPTTTRRFLGNRGWTSAQLPALGDDPQVWTVSDAARLLGPPVLSEPQLRAYLRKAGLQPVGKRRVTLRGTGGRYARCYRAEDLIQLYDALERATLVA